MDSVADKTTFDTLAENMTATSTPNQKTLPVPPDIPPVDDIKQLSEQIQALQQKQNAYNQLEPLIDQLESIVEQQDKARSQFKTLEKNFHEQLEGTCPICGQLINQLIN
jgi:peptidoglycan hydrolase CwlO-like protein